LGLDAKDKGPEERTIVEIGGFQFVFNFKIQA
jgi:hypothetical protein